MTVEFMKGELPWKKAEQEKDEKVKKALIQHMKEDAINDPDRLLQCKPAPRRSIWEPPFYFVLLVEPARPSSARSTTN